MDLSRKIGVAIAAALAIGTPISVTAAAAVNYQGFLSAGPTAGAFESKINDFLLSKSVQDFGYSIYQQGRSYGDQQESVSSTPQLNFVNKHKNAYCSPNIIAEVNGLQCKAQPGVAPYDAKYLELGDINFATVADPTLYTSLTNLTAQNLIRNIISPFPDPKIAASVANNSFMSDGTKKKDYADYMAGQATLGVALYSMNEIYGARVPGRELTLTGGQTANTSWMSLLQEQATKRYENPDFATYLADPSTTDAMVLKELAAMQAFRLWLDYQRYVQSERMEALLAAALAKMVNDSYAQNTLVQSASAPPNMQN